MVGVFVAESHISCRQYAPCSITANACRTYVDQKIVIFTTSVARIRLGIVNLKKFHTEG